MRLGRLLAVTAGVSLAAGLVGVARHQAERRRARVGLEPAIGNVEVIPTPAREDPLSRALATWTPARPATALGRAVAVAWAAPASAVGLVAAASTGGRWRWDHDHGCVVVSGGRGGMNRIQARLGFGANALGHVVITRSDEPSAGLLAHEVVHVRQAERLGVLLAPLYLWLMARWGYRRHPMERAARLGARSELRSG